MGGHASGEVASQTAITAIRDLLESLSGDHLLPSEALAAELVEYAHDRVRAEMEELRIGGTTLTLALLWRASCFVGHVGDSRAYLVRQGRLERLTRDDTMEGQGMGTGAGTALLQAVGMSDSVRVSTARLEVQPGDTLVLCSDGLYKELREDDICAVINSSADPQTACAELVQAALAAGGSDNVTVCAVQSEQPPAPRTGQRASLRKPPSLTMLTSALAFILVAIGVIGWRLLPSSHAPPEERPPLRSLSELKGGALTIKVSAGEVYSSRDLNGYIVGERGESIAALRVRHDKVTTTDSLELAWKQRTGKQQLESSPSRGDVFWIDWGNPTKRRDFPITDPTQASMLVWNVPKEFTIVLQFKPASTAYNR